MDTKIFEYLLAIEETHNITAAAERCFVSQPALSKHLHNLEKRFGFPLFEKRKDGVFPTPKGARCLRIAENMLRAERETLLKIEEYKQAKPTHLVLVLDPSLRNFFVENTWPEMQRQFPELTVSVVAVDAQTMLNYLPLNHFDIAVFPYIGAFPQGFACHAINSAEYVLVLPKGYPAAGPFSQNGVDLCRLQNETFFLMQPFSFYRQMQEQIFDSYHFRPHKTKTVSRIRETAELLRQNEGVSFLPMDHAVQLGNPFFSLNPPSTFHFVLVHPKEQPFNKYHAAVLAAFTEHLRGFERSR